MDRSTPIADLDLPAFARDLLRQWCPEVVTVGDLDAGPVRRRFATGVGLYATLGLRPIGPEDADAEVTTAAGADAGCLYVRGSLDAVRKELLAIYYRQRCARRPSASAEDRGAPTVHASPQTAWTADVVATAPAADGLVAVSSEAWALAWPGANLLAAELSKVFPVLAVTRCAAFTELSLYRGGSAYTAVTRSADPSLRAAFRPSIPKPLLVAAFGARPQWDAADALAPDALGYDGEAPADGWFAFDAAPALAPAPAPGPKPAAKPTKPTKPTKAAKRPADEDEDDEDLDDEDLDGDEDLDDDEDEDAAPAKSRAKSAPKSAPKAAPKAAKAAAKKTAAAATSGASVMAIVSKAVFDKDCPGASVGKVLGLDRYTSTNPGLAKAAGGALFLVTVRPGDKLWLVGILDGPTHGGGAWTAAASDIAVTDISAVPITFDSGATLSAAPGKLGMSLQTPRALSPATADALRAAARR